MPKPKLIKSAGEVTAKWLTSVFQAKEVKGEVVDFQAESIGTGQVGENVRFTLKKNGDIPESVVAKFAASDPVSKQTGIQLLNYKREVYFYQKLQSAAKITTPEIFFSDIDPGSHEFIILMEDLAPGLPGDQLSGCGTKEAELALIQLAHLHGSMWNRESLADDEIVSRGNKDQAPTAELYKALAPGFLERYGDFLGPEEKKNVIELGNQISSYLRKTGTSKTLIHIDYRLDNMMFGGPYPLAVVDWQSCAFGCPLNDLSYFIGTSLRSELRSESEKKLLEIYLETLSEYNVNMEWVELWNLYRHYAPAGLVMAVIASMIVGETARGNQMFLAMAKRSSKMMLELDSIDWISSSR